MDQTSDQDINPNPIQYIVKPIALNSFLSDNEIQKYETSSSIIVSHTLFETLSNSDIHQNNMLLLGLFRNNIKAFVNIDAHHYDDDNIMYVPLWIYEHLKCSYDDENIEYMHIHPNVGNKIKIKPHSDFYAYLSDPVVALRNGFEQYSILAKNTTIPILIENRVLLVDILDTYSNNAPICIRGVELEVEIEEIPEPIHVPQPEYTAPTIEETYDRVKFPGKGYSLK